MPLDSRYAFVFCVSSQMHWQHILAPKKYLIGSLAKSFQYTKSLTYKAPCNLWPKGSRPPSDGIFWHITARLWLLTNTDATPRKTRALFCVLGQPRFGGHNEANEFRREIRSWSCPPMSCNVTSSRISSAHNTKQNKCPLLIKPHNKCRPFVFPFILSTQGEHRNEDFWTATRIKSGSCILCPGPCCCRPSPPVCPEWEKGAWSHCGSRCCVTCNVFILSILKFITNNVTCKQYKNK